MVSCWWGTAEAKPRCSAKTNKGLNCYLLFKAKTVDPGTKPLPAASIRLEKSCFWKHSQLECHWVGRQGTEANELVLLFLNCWLQRQALGTILNFTSCWTKEAFHKNTIPASCVGPRWALPAPAPHPHPSHFRTADHADVLCISKVLHVRKPLFF